MAVIGAIVLVVLGGAFMWSSEFGGRWSEEEYGLRVASFNGEVFGDAKISNVGVDYYKDLISDYDLFFLLEIRDADGSSFDELCGALAPKNDSDGNFNPWDGYDCYLSERQGRSISKESVGVFYRRNLSVSGLNEYVGDDVPLGEGENLSTDEHGRAQTGEFERVPVWIDVFPEGVDGNLNGIRFWVVHLNPDDVYREMEVLELAVGDTVYGEGDIDGAVVIGDLNADCEYYSSGVDFSVEDGWTWVIGDDADTTSGFSDCAYDRIIVSSGVGVLDSGVREIDARVSDHNLVWAEVGN